MRRFANILRPTAQFGDHPELILEDVPGLGCTLRLFVDNQKTKLEMKANRTWTPAQRRYVLSVLMKRTCRGMGVCREVSPTTKMIVEVTMKRWAKKQQTTKEIDLETLFNTYWTSKARELTVPGQSSSPTSPIIADREMQGLLSLGSIVSL